MSVDECGCGRNSSDPFLCFLTAKQRKSAFRRLHLSLFLSPPTITTKKKRVVFLPLRRPPSPSAAALPTTVSIPKNFALQPPPLPPSSSPAGCFCVPSFSSAISTVAAPAPPQQQRCFQILPPSFTAFPRLPVKTEAAQEDFPQILKSRVSAIVGGVLENTFILAIRKKLTKTDLSFQNLRLSIPVNQIANEFLTNEEKLQFDKGGKVKLGSFVDPNLESHSRGLLTKWIMKSSKVYNVIKAWKSVLERRQQNRLTLEAGDLIELWSFRNASGDLCFVMINLDNETKNRIPVDSGSGTSTLTNHEENPVEICGDDDDGSSSGLNLALKL
ncbi:Putative B3 domain-containing protein At2g27410 [Linum grandiflorum]